MKKLCGFILCLCGVCKICSAEYRLLEDVIADVNPSVVSIVAENEDSQALGAGIIISADGYVVTNAHVTDGASKITLTTTDDEVFTAKFVGADEKTDIALLKAEHPVGFEPAVLADSDRIRVGNPVFAIGNPFGLGNSVSTGIISAKERDIEKGPYDNFIQTDAAINRGNSGGPLFNLNGEIIGMNTAIFSTDGVDTGVGFAVPSNTVHWVVEQLKKNGQVVRGWLGIGVQKIRSTDIEQKNKLIVASMSENSPAAAAGVEVGDVIEKLGNISLKSPRHFSLGVAQTPPNTILPLEVTREGRKVALEIKVQKAENTSKVATSYDIDAAESKPLELDTAQTADFPELGLKMVFDEVNQEFVITEVAKKSEAAAKGINVGDKFNTLNNRKVFGVEDLRVKIKESASAGVVYMQFVGEDTVDSITLKIRTQDEQN